MNGRPGGDSHGGGWRGDETSGDDSRTTPGGTSPRREGWQPRVGLGRRLRGGLTPGLPEPHPVTPRQVTPPRPPRPHPALRESGGVFASPVAVAGDAILSAEAATSDLTASSNLTAESAARLGGRAIALAGVVVVAGVVLSRLLGWVRTSVFYAQFGGNSLQLDAFWAAFRVPDTLFQLVAAGAVGSALVPVASELLARGEPERARRLIATISNLMIAVLVPLAILVWLAAPAVVSIIAPTSDPVKLSDEIGLTRVMLLSPVFLALGAVMTAGLNTVGIFGAPALAPNVYNIAIIVCAIALTPFLGIYALAWGVVLGAAGHVATQMVAVRSAGLYRPHLDVHDPAVKETLRLMAPRALGLGATQIVFLVNTYFAASLGGDGPISVYTGAFTALQIPVGLIGVPLGIVLLPPLSQAIARGDNERFRRLVDQSVRLLLFAVIPLTGLMFALATPSIAFLYQHGKFTATDTATMTPVFLVFLVGLVAHVLIALLAPIFYAGKDTRTPVTAALVAVAVDVGAAIVLFPAFHLEGIALAIGLGAWAEVAILVALMERRIGFDLRPAARHSVLFAAGGVVCAAAALLAYKFLEQATGGSEALPLRFVDLAAGSAAGVGVYVAWSWALHLPELSDARELLATLFRRTRKAA
jgi:putative peptidoglycan lipid II flippase